MASLTQLLEDIENSPEGPEVAAIFDFDSTLITGYSAVAFIREQLRRPGQLGENYGMDWWIVPGDEANATIFYDTGLYGAVSWVDMERGIGGYVAADDYSRTSRRDVHALVLDEIIPRQQQAVDEARAASAM